MSDPSDADLLRRTADSGVRGEAAFHALYQRHCDELFAFLLHWLRDRALAEDVFQEAFFRVHRHAERYDSARPFRPWLYQIARNAGLDALRLRSKEQRLRAAAPVARPGGEQVVAEVSRREAQDKTIEALERLNPESRALLIQRHGLGFKLKDLAEASSCTERTVRNRLRRAASQLVRALFHQEGGVQ